MTDPAGSPLTTTILHQCLAPPTPVYPWSPHLGEISLESTPVKLPLTQHLYSLFNLMVIHRLKQPESPLVIKKQIISKLLYM